MAVLWPAALPAAPKSASATEKLYQRCQAACVEVLVDGHLSGSGWFARADGLVVTAAHMIERRDADIEVVSFGRGRLACSLLAIDRGHDIALLKTKGAAADFPVLAFASAPLRVGDEILQFGTPLFRAGVLQPGRVARRDTAFEFYSGRDVYVEVVHVAAMMQGGTSGGPWLDQAGNVVGLQSGMMSLDGKAVGIAYVVPAAPIRGLLKTLCDAATPDAGFWVDHLWERDGESLKKLPAGTEGLSVSGVRKDGPAAQAGIQPGDVVIAAEGKKVVRIRELLEIIRARKPGEQLKLTLLRAGTAEPLQRTLTLDRAEADIAQQVPYGTGTWDAAALGNHRVVLTADKAEAVWAHVPWRRRDAEPEKKNLILIEESTGQRVTNLLRVAVSGSSGDIVFQAPNGGTYYLYYLPSISRGKSYPTVSYQPATNTADSRLAGEQRTQFRQRLASGRRTSSPTRRLSRCRPLTNSTAFIRWRSPPRLRRKAGWLRRTPASHSCSSRRTGQIPFAWLTTCR